MCKLVKSVPSKIEKYVKVMKIIERLEKQVLENWAGVRS